MKRILTLAFVAFIANPFSATAEQGKVVINSQALQEGFVLLQDGNKDKAKEKLLQCNDEQNRYDHQRALCLLLLGEIYLTEKNLNLATEAFKENYLINKELEGEESPIYAISISNMARIRRVRAELSRSLVNYKIGNKVLEKYLPDTMLNLAVNNKQMAEIYAEMKDINGFMSSADKALYYFREKPNDSTLPIIAAMSNSYSQILFSVGKNKKSYDVLSKAVNVLQKFLPKDNKMLSKLIENRDKVKTTL